MVIAKVWLILLSACVQHHAATAPNVRPPTEQLREQRGLEHAMPHFATLAKILTWTWATLEIAVLLALSDRCPPTLARPLHRLLLLPAPITANPALLTTLTPTFLAGTLLMLTGGLVRAHCFHTLGPRFTFELAIRPSHTLVTTGAYAVVRHPSYTGGAVLLAGWLLCLLDLRAWADHHACAAHAPVSAFAIAGDDGPCRAWVTSAFACLSVTLAALVYAWVHERMDKEDAMLERNFGEAWRAWAKKVPYRLVPGVC